jgi:hypothetical protein
MEQILSSHSEFYGAGELNDIKDLARERSRCNEARPSTCIATVERQNLDTLAIRYLDAIGQRDGSTRSATDEMPEISMAGTDMATRPAGPGYSLPT